MTTNFFAKAALAAAAFALPIAAQASEQKSFSRAGVVYTYTSEQAGGATVLKGKADGQPFRLVVSGKHISGQFNGAPVNFTTADVVSQRTLAMR